MASGGDVDDNGGALYSFATTSVGSGFPYVVYGFVLLGDSVSVAEGTIISASVSSAGVSSEPLATLTDAFGTWSLNLGNLKSSVDGSVLPWAADDSIFVDIEGAGDGAATDSATVSGTSPQSLGTIVLPGPIAVGEGAHFGAGFLLGQNRPNPFRPATTISVRADAEIRDGRIVIFDARGRSIRTLRVGHLASTEVTVQWDGRTDRGDRVPSGVYFYRLVADNGTSGAKRAIVLR